MTKCFVVLILMPCSQYGKTIQAASLPLNFPSVLLPAIFYYFLFFYCLLSLKTVPTEQESLCFGLPK